MRGLLILCKKGDCGGNRGVMGNGGKEGEVATGLGNEVWCTMWGLSILCNGVSVVMERGCGDGEVSDREGCKGWCG